MSIPDKKSKFRSYAAHVTVWLIFIFFGTLNRLALYPAVRINLLDVFFTHLPTIYVFYASNFILFKFLARRRYFLLALAEVPFFASYLLLYFVVSRLIAPMIYPNVVLVPFNLGQFVIECFWLFFLYSFFSIGYYFAIQTIRRERELRIAEAKNMQAERDSLHAEYAFLRSQINPHFLHNTLNFLYAKSLNLSPELSEAILTLSEVMRYSLEDMDSADGKVLLSRETENLKNVIKINQLRFNNRLNVNLAITGNIDSVRIIPLILMTLLENAFKHGELSNPHFPIVIRIDMNEDERKLCFSILNKKKTGPKELGYGIGMDNVKKRLEYAYQSNHRFIVKDEEDMYSVEVIIWFPKSEGSEAAGRRDVGYRVRRSGPSNETKIVGYDPVSDRR